MAPQRYLWVKRPIFGGRTPCGQPVDFTRHPWRGERVDNRWNVRSSHTTGFPH